MKRRKFIQKILICAIPASMISFFRKSKRNSVYEVSYTTHLPYSMSINEYKHFKDKYHNNSNVNGILEKFKSSEKIISTDHKFTGDKSIWSVVFNSKKSFLEYQKEIKSSKSIKFDPTNKNGLKTSRVEIARVSNDRYLTFS